MLDIQLYHILAAIVELQKVIEPADLVGRAVSVLLLDQFEHQVVIWHQSLVIIFEQEQVMQQSEADKIKYWQYKLQQKKNNEKNTNKTKGKARSPEKATRVGHIVNQDNFFSNTIQKFKGFLEENSHKKKGLNSTYSHKPNKHLQTSRSFQLTQRKEKIKKEDKKQKNGKIKVQTINKKPKPFAQEKEKILKLTPNKSKSKSRSKSQKYKTDKSKLQISKAKPKVLSNEVSKKRSLKTKETTKRVETIMLQSLEEQSSWKKKLMDTIIVHSENSPSVNNKQTAFVSNFKIWEEHQERQFNEKKKVKKVLQKYLRGFSQKIKYENKTKKSVKTDKLKVDFKEIVKNQEVKLLFLKQQLSNLKNSANLNESLDFLITKVNQNIFSLQNMEQPSIHREISSYSSRKSQSKQQIGKGVSLPNQESEEQNTNKTVFDQSRHSVSLSSSNWQEEEIHFEQKYSKPQESKVDNVLSVNNSIKQQAPVSPSVHKSQGSLTFRQEQESNSLKIDEKFGEITLQPLVSYQQSEKSEQQRNISKHIPQSINKVQVNGEEYISQEQVQINQKQRLEIQINQGMLTKPSKEFASEKIKIEQDQQEANPVFRRSVNHKNLQQLNQFQLLQKEPASSLFKIIKCTTNQNQLEQEQLMDTNILRLDEKTHAFQVVIDVLITEVAEFCQLFDLKGKILFSHEIKARDKLECEVIYESQQEEIVPKVQTSDLYIIQLTKKVIQYAYANRMIERLRKPLGMSSLATLKCIRKLHNQEYFEQQASAVQNLQDEIIEQYSEVIDSNFFQHFEQNFSAHSQNPYQLIFNRCVYDTINFLLDDCRPFGSKGMPGICSENYKYKIPSLQQLNKKICSELSGMMKLKMGTVKEGLSECEMQQRLRLSLNLWKVDLLRQIQKEYNYREEDDTIQRCELMMEIQEMIILQQATALRRVLGLRHKQLDMY